MGQAEINLDETLRALLRRWWLIVLIAVVVACLGLAYSYFSAPIYQVKAALLMAKAESPQSPLATALATRDDSTPVEVVYGVLTSRRAENAIVEKTGIPRKAFRKNYAIERKPPQNQLVLAFTTKNRGQGVQVLQTAIDALREVNREIGFSEGARTATYLASELAAKRDELKRAEVELANYQKRMKAPMAPGTFEGVSQYLRSYNDAVQQLDATRRQLQQARATARESAAAGLDVPTGLAASKVWRDQYVKTSHALNVARQQFGPEHEEVVKLERELAQIRKRGREEIADNLQSVLKGLDPVTAELEAKRIVLEWEVEDLRGAAQAAPAEATRLQDLYRNVTTLAQVVQQLEGQYQTAKIASSVDKVRWSVLDPPYVEEPPVNKRWGRLLATYLFVGVLVGILFSLWGFGAGKRRVA